MVLLAFQKKYPGEFEFFGLGGAVAERAGLKLIENIVNRAVIGFVEAVKNLGYFRNLLNRIDGMMARKEMDGLLLIDYPGLNLHIARLAARHKLPVVFYISPQVWAWRRGRAKTLARRIKKMLVLFPFEVPIYEEAGCPVEWVGHPFVDRVRAEKPRDAARRTIGVGERDGLVAIMPGSRRQEVERHFPVMWEAVKRLAAQRPLSVVIGVASTIPAANYRYLMTNAPKNLKSFLIEGESNRHMMVAASDVAMVTTGTTTIETAILGTPMLAGYRLSAVSYAIAKMLANIRYCAMPNILANEEIVPEFIQDRFTPEHLASAAMPFIADPSYGDPMRAKLKSVAALLGQPGAAERIADSAAKVFLS